jgi:hypothetical protein
MRIYLEKLILLILLILFSRASAEQIRLSDIQLPEYSGRRYDAKVPDTLDLAERCSLVARCMTTQVDPARDYTQYFFVFFGRDPAWMLHNESDGCTDKFVEALPFQRVASGNMVNSECEKSWIRRVLTFQGLNGRLLAAAGLYYKLTGNEAFKKKGIDVIEAAKTQVIYEDDYAYLPHPQRVSGANVLTDPDRNYHSMLWIIDGLMRFYRMTRYEPAFELAGQFTRGIMQDECYYYHGHEEGSFADEPIMWPGVQNKQHFHCNTLIRLACLEYSIAAGDQQVIDWVYKGYNYAKERGDSVTGWFPEALNGDVNAVYNVCEMCAAGDMIQLAIRLAQAGYDACWDDADCWIRNMLAEGQLTHIDWLEAYYQSDYCRAGEAFDQQQRGKGVRLIQYLEEKFGKDNICAENVAQRNVGGFGGWIAMNDWFGGHDIRTKDGTGYAIMHCCTGNCARALYASFYNILTYQSQQNALKINFFLNRASKWADIDSHLPYTGKVEIKIKEKVDLSVRIPAWVDLDQVTIRVNKEKREIMHSGRYLQIGIVEKNQSVEIHFPIKKIQKSVGVRYYDPAFNLEECYTLTLKGHTVIEISPKGQFCPLYKRNHYKQDKTRYRKIERFISDQELPW